MSQGRSTVAVVIPAYNAGAYLANTLSSLVAQTARDWRCTVIDDGSMDDTAAIARSFTERDDRIGLVQQANQGVAASRNRGLDMSVEEFVMFLDADDMLLPDAISSLRSAFDDWPGVPAVHGGAVVVDGSGIASPKRGYEQEYARQKVIDRGLVWSGVPRCAAISTGDATEFSTFALRNPITTPGQVLLRRHALTLIGGFDSTVQPSEDWDMWLRLSQLGGFGYVPRPVIQYRAHPAGASAQLSNIRAAELRVRHKTIRTARQTRDRGPVSANTNRPLEDADVERLARIGMQHAEGSRARQRLVSALRHFLRAQIFEAARDVLRAASSVYQIGLARYGLRSRR